MQYSAARNTKGLTGRQAILLTRRFASRLPTEFYPLCSQGWNTAQFEDISFHIVCNDVRLRLLKKLTLLIIESCPARDLLLRADTKPNRNSDSLRAVGQMQKPVNRYTGGTQPSQSRRRFGALPANSVISEMRLHMNGVNCWSFIELVGIKGPPKRFPFVLLVTLFQLPNVPKKQGEWAGFAVEFQQPLALKSRRLQNWRWWFDYSWCYRCVRFLIHDTTRVSYRFFQFNGSHWFWEELCTLKLFYISSSRFLIVVWSSLNWRLE